MTRPRFRPTRGVLAASGLAVAVLTGCGSAPVPPPTTTPVAPTPSSTASPAPSPTPAPPSAGVRPARPPAPRGEPERVVVTTRDGRTLVDASVAPDGLDERGILSPPAGVVGWYDEPGWPRPGHPGAAILAGHVGIRQADVFRDLPQARPGDRVRVWYDSGDVVRFVVRRSSGVPKEQTPRDDTIWAADSPEPLLRLITCDPRTPLESGHYEGNWVLWADLA